MCCKSPIVCVMYYAAMLSPDVDQAAVWRNIGMKNIAKHDDSFIDGSGFICFKTQNNPASSYLRRVKLAVFNLCKIDVSLCTI